MSSDDETSISVPCVTTQSTNSLKLKISFSGSKTHGHGSSEHAVDADVPAAPFDVTSKNLFTVLMEVHRQLVHRDPRGIFANPVTDEIAAGYSQTIKHPMDLGTIYTRLASRAHYRSATDYLADVTLMCDNAMVYNAPNTIYFERARKLLLFCRKLLMAPSLRKLCLQLGLKDELTTAEMGESSVSGELPQHHGKLNSVCCRRLSGQDGGGALRSSRYGLGSPKRDWYLLQSSSSQPTPSRLTLMSRGGSAKRRGRPPRRIGSPQFRSKPMLHKEIPKDQVDSGSKDDSLLSSGGSTTVDDSFSPSVPPTVHSTSTPDTPTTPPKRPRGRPRKTPKVEPTTTSEILPPLSPEISAAPSSISSPDPPISRITRRASFSSPNSTQTDSSQVVMDDVGSEGTNLTPVSTPIAFENTSISSTPFPSAQPPNLSSASDHKPLQCDSTPASANLSPVLRIDTSPTLPRARSSVEFGSSTLGRKRKRSVDSRHSLKVSATKKRPGNSHISPVKSKGIKIEKPCSPRRKRRPRDSEDDMDSLADSKASSPSSVNPSELRDTTPIKSRRSLGIQVDEPEDETLMQARQAAAQAAARLRSKYSGGSMNQLDEPAVRFGPRIVYLNHEERGEVTATDCPKAQSYVPPSTKSQEVKPMEQPPVTKVHYPPAFVRCMTGGFSDNKEAGKNFPPTKTLEDIRNKVAANPLLEPLSCEKQEILKQLEKLKYGPDEPLSAAIHGPLAIFSNAEMARFSDVYGCDLTVIEYAYSLLQFVEPIGPWARRWAAKRLDAATDGMHSQLAHFSQATAPIPDCLITADDGKPRDPNNDPSYPPVTTWMQSVHLTVDPPTPPSSPEPTSFLAALDEKPDLSVIQTGPPDDSSEKKTILNGLGVSQSPSHIDGTVGASTYSTTSLSSGSGPEISENGITQAEEPKVDSPASLVHTTSHSHTALVAPESLISQVQSPIGNNHPIISNPATSSTSIPSGAPPHIVKHESHQPLDRYKVDQPSSHTSVLKAVLSAPVSELNLLADRANHHGITIASTISGSLHAAAVPSSTQQHTDLVSHSSVQMITQTCNQTLYPELPTIDSRSPMSASTGAQPSPVAQLPVSELGPPPPTEENKVTEEPREVRGSGEVLTKGQSNAKPADVYLADILGDGFEASLKSSPTAQPTEFTEQPQSDDACHTQLDNQGSGEEIDTTVNKTSNLASGIDDDNSIASILFGISSGSLHTSQNAQPVETDKVLPSADQLHVKSSESGEQSSSDLDKLCLGHEPKTVIPESSSSSAELGGNDVDDDEPVTHQGTSKIDQAGDRNEKSQSNDGCCINFPVYPEPTPSGSPNLQAEPRATPVEAIIHDEPDALCARSPTGCHEGTGELRGNINSLPETSTVDPIDEKATTTPQLSTLETAETEDQFIHDILYGVYADNSDTSQTEQPMPSNEQPGLDGDCLAHSPVAPECFNSDTDTENVKSPDKRLPKSANLEPDSSIEASVGSQVPSELDQPIEPEKKPQSVETCLSPSPNSPICSGGNSLLSGNENVTEVGTTVPGQTPEDKMKSDINM